VAAALGVVAFLIVNVAVRTGVRLALHEVLPQDRMDNTKLPPFPPAPAGGTTYVGKASDGMPVMVIRSADRVWTRVDSHEGGDCRVGEWIGKNFASRSTGLRGRGFAVDGTLASSVTWQHRYGPVLVPTTLPKHVSFRIRGEFLPGGRARGTFMRRDRARDGDHLALDCTRRVTWSASRVR
jgi:hypothetical protein